MPRTSLLLFACLILFPVSAIRGSEGDAVLLRATTVLTGRGEDFPVRDHASHALPRTMSTADVDALLSFLLRQPNEDAASADELASLKNNTADALLVQTELPPTLLDTFKTAFADPTQGEIWREYVVQKIPELVRRAATPQREQGLAFLRERLADKAYIYAGTALLGLQRLHEADSSLVPASEVAAGARDILADEVYAQASKITSLQILARHNPAGARPIARDWLKADAPAMLKVSALATLGMVGEVDDTSLLEHYADSPDLRLRSAARAALGK